MSQAFGDEAAYERAVENAALEIRAVIDNAGHKDFKPEFAITLGSGLGDLAKNIDVFATIAYEHISNFPKLNVQGHAGQMLIGYLAGVPIIGLSGRKHYYEVASELYGMLEVVFPIHVMASLGVKNYFATNAVGSLNEEYEVGDMMIIRDHIDLFMPDPLVGPHLDFGGNLYFQPQNNLYDKELSDLFHDMVLGSGFWGWVHNGVYVARTGRTYETAAASRALRVLGADAVGMSVVPEIIVAANRGMRTMAVSIVTNTISHNGTNATSHEEVMAILNSEKIRTRLKISFSEFFNCYHRRFMQK